MNPLISFPAPELEISRVSGAVPCLLPLAAPTPALLSSYLSSPGAVQWQGGDVGQRVQEPHGRVERWFWGFGGCVVQLCFGVPLACRLSCMHAGCAPGDGAGPRDGVLPMPRYIGSGCWGGSVPASTILPPQHPKSHCPMLTSCFLPPRPAPPAAMATQTWTRSWRSAWTG